MQYIVDDDKYLLHISFGSVVKYGDKTSEEYTGDIPEGYDSLEEWFIEVNGNEALNAWKVVDSTLVFDSNKYNKLVNKYELETNINKVATIGYVNEKLNQVTSVYDETLVKTTNKLKIEDSSNNVIPEIVIRGKDENNLFPEGIKLQVSNENLLVNTAVSQTISGVNFIVNEDKTITIFGTATADIEYIVSGSMDNTEPIFMLDKFCSLHYLIMPMPIEGDAALIPKLYSYDGVDRELVCADYIFEPTDNKYITCATLFIASGTEVDSTINFYIRKDDDTADNHRPGETNKILDIPVYELKQNEKIIIGRNIIKVVNDEDETETLIKTIDPIVSYDIENNSNYYTLIQCSEDLDINTTYYTNIQLAGFNVTSDGFTTEIFSNYDYTQEDIDKAYAYVRNQGTLTEEELVKYDVNGDGVVNVYDVSYMSQLIKYGITTSNGLKFSICNKEQKNMFNFMKVIDGNNNLLTNISAGGITTNRLIVNDVDIFEKNIITLGLSGNFTPTVTSWTNYTVPFDIQKNKLGERLTFENNGITIGSGVSEVLISGNVMIRGTISDIFMQIRKNDVIISQGYYRPTVTTNYGTIGLTPQLVSVTEGDRITIEVGAGANSTLTITGQSYSWLTVEAKTIEPLGVSDSNINIDQNIYSNEERVIGKWIDDKPLYRKSIEINIATAGNAQVVHGIENAESIWINQEASYLKNGIYVLPIAQYGGASGNDWFRFFTTTTHVLYRFGATYTNTTNLIAVVTLNYTKTTD